MNQRILFGSSAHIQVRKDQKAPFLMSGRKVTACKCSLMLGVCYYAMVVTRTLLTIFHWE
ncbi:hypothetical protein DsansV1_C01g0005611 [Dioscorea sansibarensis]